MTAGRRPGASRAVTERFSRRRARTALDDQPRAIAGLLELGLRPMLGALGLPTEDGLRDTSTRAFTDRANYALFDDVARSSSARGRGIHARYSCRTSRRGSTTSSPTLASATRSRAGDLGDRGHREARPADLSSSRSIARAWTRPTRSYVGDNPEFDVDPPAALGMFPVLIDRRRAARGSRRGPHHGPGGLCRGPRWVRTNAGSRPRRRTRSSPTCASGCRGCGMRAER